MTFPIRSLLAAALVLCGCSTTQKDPMQHEEFDYTSTYSRNFKATDAQTCEAARRALLSQGYVISVARNDLVQGRKSFQPDRDTHLEIEFRVVCAADGNSGKSTIAFVNALQDRYALKKSNNSASVGVGVIGSVSLPFSSSDDSLVKVASETVTIGTFYDRFFDLLKRYLVLDELLVQPASEPPVAPMPAASAASGSAR
jgi:Uncharacterized protein conserved in bacteria (DUF2242)